MRRGVLFLLQDDCECVSIMPIYKDHAMHPDSHVCLTKSYIQGTHATGKTGKMAKKKSVRENREFGNFAKTQGIWFAQVVNISIFAAKISIFWGIWVRQFCVCYSHKSRKLAQGNFTIRQGKNRENTGNLKT